MYSLEAMEYELNVAQTPSMSADGVDIGSCCVAQYPLDNRLVCLFCCSRESKGVALYPVFPCPDFYRFQYDQLAMKVWMYTSHMMHAIVSQI